jgi:hypothetical protein
VKHLLLYVFGHIVLLKVAERKNNNYVKEEMVREKEKIKKKEGIISQRIYTRNEDIYDNCTQ